MTQLAAFTQSLTASQIVQAADREAGSPGLYLDSNGSEAITTYAYTKLQGILDDLALSWDWPFRNDAVSVQVSTRTTQLPTDYWRLTVNSAWITVPGTGRRIPLQILATEDYHNAIVPAEEGSGMPTAIALVKNSGAAAGGTPHGILWTDRVPDQTYFIDLLYSPLATPITATSNKPWFPWSHYLIKALAVELFAHQDDSRRADVAMERDKLFRNIRRSLADVGQRAATVRHSRTVFRDPIRL